MAITTYATKDGTGTAKNIAVSDLPGGGTLANAFHVLQGATEVSNTNPLPVCGKIINPSATLTLPTVATTYAVGDLVANNVSGASVTPLTFDFLSGEFLITGMRVISNRTTSTALGQFTLMLYSAAPTIASGALNGDDAAYSSVVSFGSAKFLGALDFSFDVQHADGYTGTGVPPVRPHIPVKLASGTTIRGLVRARNTYARSTNETMEFILDGIPNS